MATMTHVSQPPSEWEQFKEMIELHKFYFEHLAKSGAVSLGIVGAVASFVISSEIRDSARLSIALIFPILLSLGVFGFTVMGAVKTRDLALRVKSMQTALGIGWRPHAEVLSWICSMFAAFSLLIAGILFYVARHPELLPAPLKE